MWPIPEFPKKHHAFVLRLPALGATEPPFSSLHSDCPRSISSQIELSFSICPSVICHPWETLINTKDSKVSENKMETQLNLLWNLDLFSLERITCELSRFSHVQLFETPWTVARQAPLSMGFSRQEYWSRWPFPLPGDLSDPGIKPMSFKCLLHWQACSYHYCYLESPAYLKNQ